jgi:Family of unknown function (DUF6459)
MTSQVRARESANGDVALRPGGRLRRLPVPVTEPHALRWAPRERTVMPSSQGMLALSFSTERAYRPEPDPQFGPQPTSSSDLPDPATTCSALIQAVIEVLGGTRPASQLARWLSSDVYSAVSRRAALAARMRRGAAPSARHAVVRAVRVCEPADGVVEGSAVVVEQGRVRAVALRLEGMDGRWRATAVEVG